MTILCIETSGAECSVAVSVGENVVFERVSEAGQSHAEKLGVFTEEALRAVPKGIDAVAVSGGPGSYTGLRIGVSLAKGLCFGLQTPLISIPTLYIIAAKTAAAVAVPDRRGALFCPMIDARRKEVYAAVYDDTLNIVRATEAVVLTDGTFNYGKPVYFSGSGAAKFKSITTDENAVFPEGDFNPKAADMAVAAAKAFIDRRFEDTAYFEPFYLKDFIATKPKNKVFT